MYIPATARLAYARIETFDLETPLTTDAHGAQHWPSADVVSAFKAIRPTLINEGWAENRNGDRQSVGRGQR